MKRKKQKSINVDLTLKGLKRECVSRGLPFDDVLKLSIPDMTNWLYRNNHKHQDMDLVDQYDDYIEKILIDLGSGDMVHPSLRLGYIGDKNSENDLLDYTPKKEKVKKPKVIKERTAEGIYSGTKKALTYQCQKEGKNVEETIEIVKNTFDDASEKSIKIWYRKAARG